MSLGALEKLAVRHRPRQFSLLKRLIDLFSECAVVTDLAVRGSLATGSADRLSDVDLIVGVEDQHLGDLVAVHDTLLRVQLGSVIPGWRDRIVRDFGGVGFVHLVPWEGRLQQIDLYIVPASVVDHVCDETDASKVLARNRDPAVGASVVPEPASASVVPEPASASVVPEPAGALQLLVEALVIGYLIRKRIARGDRYLAYSESAMLATAAKDLIKLCLVPNSRVWGWYRLDAEIGVTNIGRACLADLDALVSEPAVPTFASLDRALGHVLSIARRVAPDAVHAVRPALDAYWPHLELP